MATTFAQRVRMALTVFFLGAVAAVTPLSSVASADSGSGLSGSPFNGRDGVIDTTPADQLTTINDDTGDSQFTGGTKVGDNPCSATEYGQITPKDDFLTMVVGSDVSADHAYLYLAWTRAQGQGTATVSFELNQSSTACSSGSHLVRERSADDLLISYDYHGGQFADVYAQTWTGSGWSAAAVPVGSAAAEAAPAADELSGELVIDLYAAGILSPGVCRSYGNATLISRASMAVNAQMKDLVAGQATFSTCGSVRFTKTGNGGAPLAGVTFGLYTDATATTPLLSGGTPVTCLTGTDGKCTINDLSQGTYYAKEVAVPAGYSLSATIYTVTITPDVITDIGPIENIPVPGSVIVHKTADGQGPLAGAGFTLSVNSSGTPALAATTNNPCTTGATGTCTIGNVPPGTYWVVETTVPTGYTGADPQKVTVPLGSAVGVGGSADVYFDDATKPSSISVDKKVNGSDGPIEVLPNAPLAYTVDITNTGELPVVINSVTDTLHTIAVGECSPAIGSVLQPGDAMTCTYSGSATAEPTVNTVTASGVDQPFGRPVSGSDSTTVTLLPTLSVDKTASPTIVPETGGNVTFTFVVTNSSLEPVTITSLTDSVYGTLTGDGDCQVGTVLAAGASCTFTKTELVSGDYSGPDHVDVFTATANDADGHPATDSDDATVAFSNVVPQISVVKTANPTSVPETGGNVTFTFVVDNTSTAEPVTITSLSDSVYGTLAGDSDCQVGTVLAAGASCEFSITRWVEGDFSGPDHVNVFTAHAVDNDGTDATDSDDATVDFTDVPPAISVLKSASPAAVPESGADVTFTFVVNNTSTEEPVTITSLEDDVYGTLAGDADCQVGTILAAGASCEFTITRWVEGDFSGPDHVNVFTAHAVDNDGTDATDDDDAVVEFTDVPPVITVEKTADPTSMPEPGGTATFTVTVTNDSAESVTISSLEDNVYGNLTGDTDCQVGTVLAAGDSCTFDFDGTVGPDAGLYTDVVTAVAVDNDGTDATDDDDATVEVTDVLPVITVDKTASPTTMPEPGGTATFTVTVTNDSVEPVTITSLVDDVYGELEGDADCQLGTVLDPDESCTFAFTGAVGPDAGTYTDVVTAKAVDNEENVASDEDDATVTVTNVNPTITVDKVASPTSVSPGGVVTFTVTVTNTSVEPVTITRLVDDVYGTLTGDDDCKVGTVLDPGESCTFSFTETAGTVAGDYTDVVTVDAQDNEGSKASDTDDATFTILPTAVLGVTVERTPELPRTGFDVFPPVAAGLTLLSAGGVLVLVARVGRRQAHA